MTTILLVVLLVWVVYLALRIRRLEQAVAALTRTVDTPRKRDRAIRKEIKELEDQLAFIGTTIAKGAAGPADLEEADAIRERLDRRLRALAGRADAPASPPRSTPEGPLPPSAGTAPASAASQK